MTVAEAWRRDLKKKPITNSNQDTDGSSLRGNEEVTTRQSSYIRTPLSTAKILCAEIFPVLLIICIPFSVQAGIFTSLLGMAQDTQATTTVQAPAVHAGDIALLSARTNPDVDAARGGGDVIVDEGALLASGPFAADDVAESKEVNGEISVYVVREGDALSQIAEMFEVTTNTILWANDLPSATAIAPGDTLVILPIVGVRHVVKKDDSISAIAKKYKGDVDEILAYNQLTTDDAVTVGQTLVIPGGNMHRAAPKKVAAKKAATPTKTTGAASYSGSVYAHPVPGAVRTQGLHGYNAVDLAAPVGTPIRASAAGEVIVAKSSGYNGGYGNYVVIKHPKGSQTLYAHNSSNTVGVGAYVAQGQVIGYVGNTGRSTGSHVHFEVRGANNPF